MDIRDHILRGQKQRESNIGRSLDLEKGTYKDNYQNKKLGRIGQQYGGKKKEGSSKKRVREEDFFKIMEKEGVNMRELDEGLDGMGNEFNEEKTVELYGRLISNANSKIGVTGAHYSDKGVITITLDIEKKETKGKKEDKGIDKGVEILMSIGGPQDYAFIGGFSLARNYENWKEEILEEVEEEDKTTVLKTLEHFEKNVSGKIIDEYDLLEPEVDEEEEEFPFEVEESYSVSKLKETSVEVPEGMTYFAILPVDYNRGTSDIAIAFMTDEGRKYYDGKMSGDY